MKRLRNVWEVNIFGFFFSLPPPILKMHIVLGNRGGILHPSTKAWWFLCHLWFSSRTEITSFGGGAELAFSLPAHKCRQFS